MGKTSTHSEVDQKPANVESASALEVIERDKMQPGDYGAYVGLDVHKDSIAVAVARELVGFIWDIACQEMPKLAAATAH